MEFDKDLAARQEARELARQAKLAQERLAEYSQEQLDTIVRAVADAFVKEAVSLAEEAVQETGFGNIRDKTAKNRFAAEKVLSAVKDMKTVGLLSKDPEKKLWEIGVPMGVIAAIVPSTNPHLYGLLQGHYRPEGGLLHCLFSPSQGAFLHPAGGGADCQSGRGGGSAKGAVSCLSHPMLSGCQELMSAPEVSLILATGGPGMVRAAYSSGKPAIGVGAGNGRPISTTARMCRAPSAALRPPKPLITARSVLPSRASLWKNGWRKPFAGRHSGRASIL